MKIKVKFTKGTRVDNVFRKIKMALDVDLNIKEYNEDTREFLLDSNFMVAGYMEGMQVVESFVLVDD